MVVSQSKASTNIGLGSLRENRSSDESKAVQLSCTLVVLIDLRESIREMLIRRASLVKT